MRIRSILSLLLLPLILSFSACSQNPLRSQIEKIIDGKKLTLGFAVENLQTGQKVTINGEKRFPMQSVYKLPIAVVLLKEVEGGRFGLDDTIKITPADYQPDTWSPLAERYPEGVAMTLSEVITYMVAFSDNNATDLLLDKIGGPKRVQDTIDSLEIRDIRIQNTEKELHASPALQYANYATPDAMIRFLKLFADGKLLKGEVQSFLWKVMADCATGSVSRKIPGDITVAHKTGSSGTDADGITAAVNDVGLIRLDNGDLIAFAIFITGSAEPADDNYDIIAEIGAAVYRFFTNQ